MRRYGRSCHTRERYAAPVHVDAATVAPAAVGAVLGWCAGLVSAHTMRRLVPGDDSAGPHGRVLAPDLLVQAGVALVWLLIPVVVAGPTWRWLVSGMLAVPLVQVAVTDLRTRYVYTVVAAAGLAGGLVFGGVVHDAAWWWGPVGALVGLLIFGLLYGLGRLVYRGGEPLARGDVTIAAMVGAIAGPYVLTALFAGTLLSGVAALGVGLAARSRHALMPYGPGLCLGGLLSLFMGVGT